MPDRIIKESAFTSEKIAALTDFEFRVWVGLITMANDRGVGDARPAIIKGRIFALRERLTLRDIDNALRTLAAHGCVSLFTRDGKPYYAFPKWAEYYGAERQTQKQTEEPAPVKKKPTPKPEVTKIPEELPFSGELETAFEEWIQYKNERRQTYTPTGLKSLITQIRHYVERFGKDATVQTIRDSMASGYQGIVFDRTQRNAGRGRNERNGGYTFLDMYMEDDGT